MRSASRHREGYVLLLVLLTLAMAGVALAQAARRVARQSLGVMTAEQELQRRFGALSCQRVLLPQGEAMIQHDDAEDTVERLLPRRSARRQITLGGIQFTLLWADEQAKPDINALQQRLGPSKTNQAVDRLILGERFRAEARLQPGASHNASVEGAFAQEPPDPQRPADDRRYIALDQVFVTASLMAQISALAHAASSEQADPDPPVTCWGKGKLNLHRATDMALQEWIGDVLDAQQMNELLDLRREFPGLGTPALLSQLELEQKQRAIVMDRLTDHSLCHSLWIVADTEQRTYCRLAVYFESKNHKPQVWSFDW